MKRFERHLLFEDLPISLTVKQLSERLDVSYDLVSNWARTFVPGATRILAGGKDTGGNKGGRMLSHPEIAKLTLIALWNEDLGGSKRYRSIAKSELSSSDWFSVNSNRIAQKLGVSLRKRD